MKETTYIIKGKPVPWKRSGQNGAAHYDTQKKEKFVYGVDLRNQHNHEHEELWEGPIHVNITFFMPMASSMSQNKKRSLIGTYHFSRPDLDNLIKFVKDAATGIIYADDAIIASLNARKIYSSNPYTKIVVRQLEVESSCLC